MRLQISARRLLGIFAVAGLLAGGAAHAARPAHAPAAAKLRYDGLYRTRQQVAASLAYRRYILFYRNGEAIAFGSTGSLETIVSRINSGIAAQVFPHAKVTIVGDRIAIRDPNCEYTGKIAGKRLRLMRTCSNEPKPSLDEYAFVRAPLKPEHAPPATPQGGPLAAPPAP